MKLSILIPTLPERFVYLKRLRKILDPQVARFNGEVEIRINDAGKSMTTGAKRNQLIANSIGEYFIQVDDDDQVPTYYVDELMKAIDRRPDVITFVGYMTTNGENRRDFTIKLGERYEERHGRYYRFPNHICAYRREVVKNIPFPNITVQEDYQWALRVKQSRVLKTEVHINKEMYHYQFRTKK